jgi:hypothetical protein
MITFEITMLVILGAYAVALAAFIDPHSLAEPDAWVPYALVTLGIAILFFASLNCLKRRSRPGETLLHPPVFITGWSLFMISLPGLFAFWDPQLLVNLEAFTPVSYAYATVGMGLMFVGLICLWAGYFFGLRVTRPIQSLRAITLSNIRPSVLALVYLFTIAAQLIHMSIAGFTFGIDRSQLGQFEAFDQWIAYLEDVRWLVLAIAGWKTFAGEWRPYGFIAISVVEIINALTSGFMKPLLWVIVVISLTAVYTRAAAREHALYFLCFLPLGILIVPLTEEIRKDFSGSGFDARSAFAITESAIRGFESSWGRGFDVGFEAFKRKMLSREAEVSHMPGIIMSQTPSSFAYEGFERLILAVPSSFIPRALWPDKPSLTRGTWFSYAYLNIPESVETSSAITIFGEAYMYRGWVATVLVMLVLGVFLAALFQNTVGAGLAPLYISLIPALDAEGQFTIMILTLTYRFLIGLFVCWLLSRVSNRLREDRPHFDHSPPLMHLSPSGEKT